MQMFVTGGDGVPNGDGTSGMLGSVAEDVVPYADPRNVGQTIDYAAPANADLYARGLRVGYTPLTITTRATLPHGGVLGPVLSQGTLRLDPSVILVPVQVVVVWSDDDAVDPLLRTLPAQLNVWDQWQPVSNPFHGSDQGDLTVSSRTLDLWMDRKTLSGWNGLPYSAYSRSYVDEQGSFTGYFTPDSIWQSCGVQFRLVNFLRMHVDRLHNKVSNLTPGEPCNDLLSMAGQLSGFLSEVPTVIFTRTYSGQGGAIGGDTFGQTIDLGGTQPVSCLTWYASGPPAVLAHEVGHWTGALIVLPAAAALLAT